MLFHKQKSILTANFNSRKNHVVKGILKMTQIKAISHHPPHSFFTDIYDLCMSYVISLKWRCNHSQFEISGISYAFHRQTLWAFPASSGLYPMYSSKWLQPLHEILSPDCCRSPVQIHIAIYLQKYNAMMRYKL